MTEFKHIIKDEIGLHARPAGMLVKEAAKFNSKVSVIKGEKKVDCKRLFAIMSLSAKCGEELRFEIEGDDEKVAADAVKAFCEEQI